MGWQGQHDKGGLISRSEWHRHIRIGIHKGIGVITLLLAMLRQWNDKGEHAACSMVVSSFIFFDMMVRDEYVSVCGVWVWYYLPNTMVP